MYRKEGMMYGRMYKHIRHGFIEECIPPKRRVLEFVSLYFSLQVSPEKALVHSMPSEL
jgi:hypothetical protein